MSTITPDGALSAPLRLPTPAPAGLPAWYLPLRLRLTGIASLCLLSALSLPWWVAP